ncbi:N-acetylmuramoyl-L-alanine amidase-like domain-containing protein [uncultured Draconibacterium sp.]|uniref:N-acetylmuramoyl-L-alanine amidase-like domain-containing protein n=1 Tax=uncultured Draconibacterium sp. TaxID=1573823 RepID=UPI002AA7024C|nr:N-acetylmuramoyl-L-alanine amidase-like domain-containing protein [uncultured Draconibacterium sp.]
MRTKFFLLSITVIFCFSIQSALSVTKKEDKKIVERIISELKEQNSKSTAELVVEAGKLLMNTPYVANTLETTPEQLVINLRELDCTTFAENCLALARTCKSTNPSFDVFKKELQHIRYRNGEIDGYPSRLHYFSDWIADNDTKQIVESVSRSICNIKFDKTINFMSHHPDSYKALSKNAVFLAAIDKQEKQLTKSDKCYIPTEKLEALKHLLKNGDIIGITTNIDGLDITHVGIIVFKGDELHFMHASSKAEKVIVSEETLYTYLSNRKSATGVMVARPL